MSSPKKTRKVCIGFGEFEGKCKNPAGASHSPHWCQRCDDLRIDHLTEQFKKMSDRFGQKPGRQGCLRTRCRRG